MSSNSPPGISNQNRLYTRFITALKVVQYIGYFVVAIYNTVLVFGFSKIVDSPIFEALGQEFLFPTLLKSLNLTLIMSALVDFLAVYIVTQSLIAIIDLLSRIERNTRIEK